MDSRYVSPRSGHNPRIYAYTDNNPQYNGYLKVGYTDIDVATRVAQQYPTLRPGNVPYTIVLNESALYDDGTSFMDHDVHSVLDAKGFPALRTDDGKKTEWYECTVDDVKAAIIAVRTRTENYENRTQTFAMRDEQKAAVEKTIAYFENAKKISPERTPKFLWNAKMRFGKTFTAYQLAKRLDAKRVLILTFKPAVVAAWKEDLLTHVDFEGWQFISRPKDINGDKIDVQYEKADKNRPIVCFGSFQDFLGLDENGNIKAHHEWVHDTYWDVVIFDEYHFGAWRDNAQKLFRQDEDKLYDEEADEEKRAVEISNAMNETWLPIESQRYLYMSGTPFRAISNGEFIEDQIFNWTYADEQSRKEEQKDIPNNPYAALPRMIMLAYQMPAEIERIAKQGEFDEFDLNEFFSANGRGSDAVFVHEEYVQKWLDLIRGEYLGTAVADLKLGAQKPPMPFSDIDLKQQLNHTLWFLPNVASCFAMANLLAKRNNVFYHDYKVLVCAGTQAGIGVEALPPVQQAMHNPLESKTITLSCGKLTTGVTVKPWTGIFMLRNLSSPETYFQAAFRVQSPWEIRREDGTKEIVKQECFVFDFALNRALRQISDYSCRLSVKERSPEKKVEDFIKFLPVLAYSGGVMREINAAEILDITMSGTTATLLAKRWQSALLVNVDNDTLARLLASDEAMKALESIEGFRNLNTDIETIINTSEHVKKVKKDKDKLTKKQKKELTDEEKEYKSKRKMIQDKLIKFATRIPVFMYLTDLREECLRDVITQLEPKLFKKVTGLKVQDFELLCSLNIFNESLMNDAVYKFWRYEESSLTYSGINRHEGERIGLYSTTLSNEDYEILGAQLERSNEISKKILQPKEKSKSKVKPKKTAETKKESSAVSFEEKVEKSQRDIGMLKADDVPAGTRILHSKFGYGKVEGIERDLVTVAFDDKKFGRKSFGFPFAFYNKFLKFADEEGKYGEFEEHRAAQPK